MKTLKLTLAIALGVLVTTHMAMAGCGSCPGDAAKKATPKCSASKAKAKPIQVVLCGDCGQVKGTDACCADGAKKCGKCNLAKGAPGCCKMTAGKDVVLTSCATACAGQCPMSKGSAKKGSGKKGSGKKAE